MKYKVGDAIFDNGDKTIYFITIVHRGWFYYSSNVRSDRYSLTREQLDHYTDAKIITHIPSSNHLLKIYS